MGGGSIFDRWFWPIIQPLLTPLAKGETPNLVAAGKLRLRGLFHPRALPEEEHASEHADNAQEYLASGEDYGNEDK